MSQPFIGEIRLMPYPRGAPTDWQLCDGSLLPIAQYEALYTLLGTTYGGDGQNTFGVPDMRGRVPIHQGTGMGLSTYALGQVSGSETVTLTTQQMPAHIHLELASTANGDSANPASSLPASIPKEAVYSDGTGSPYALPANTIGMTGSNLPHDNCGPTLTLNYCIALFGIFPQQS
jgi:microcystin-dependent protein